MDDYPDDNQDEDISLGNLHYGLDSSVDENASGAGRQDLSTLSYAGSGIGSKETVVAENQINLLQDMVLEMKEGFQTALGELMKIQVKEEAEASHSKKLQQQQQEQLAQLTETIGEIKQQLSSLATSVEQIKDEQKMLKDSLEEVRSNRESSQEHRLLSDRSNLLDDFSSHSEEWKFSEPQIGIGDRNMMRRTDEDVTATACKSLSLTQALGEECQRFNLAQSSGDEDEDQSILRMSNNRQNHIHHVTDQMVDRQHNLPVYEGLQDRNKNISSTVQRQRAVTELADSEREYCFQLWSLRHTYLASLHTAGLLNTRELDLLIPTYLDQLYTEHCHICTELQDKLLHWTFMSTVADPLSRVADYYNSDSLLSLYQEYANDLPIALSFLRRTLAQSSEFRLFLKAIKHSSCQSEDLMSLLLSPVQRIPKYLLQVQEIFRQTPPSHADFPHLQTLLHQLQNFVDQLNDVLFNTMEDLHHDEHTRSDFLNGHLLSARDSGVHSTSTEDDYITSARSFLKTRSHVPSEWIEGSYHTVHQRQTRASQNHINSLSHPDLTVYNKISNMSVDPLTFTHIPRSQSLLPATDDSGNYAAARQRIQKFKIKMRSPSPARYTAKTQDNHSGVSPDVRPASSADFLRQYNHHQQHNGHNDLPEQSRSFQCPIPQLRSHSALGLHTMNSNYRPVVISRKNGKRPQSSIPPANRFWDESIASATLPTKLNLHKTNSTVNNSQHLTHQTSNIVNNHQDEEDDTRSCDTNSLGANGSYPYINGQGLNGGPETKVNLTECHVDNQSSQNEVLDYDPVHSPQFISVSGSQKPNNTQEDARRDESMLVRQVSNKASKSLTTKLKEQQFKASTDKIKYNQISRPLINEFKKGQPLRTSTNQTKVIQPLRPSISQTKGNQQSRLSTNQIEENQSSKPLTNNVKDNEESKQSVNQTIDIAQVQEQPVFLNSLKVIDKSMSSSVQEPKLDNEKDPLVLPSRIRLNLDCSVSSISSTEQNFLDGSNANSRLVQERSGSIKIQGVNETNSLTQEGNVKRSYIPERNESCLPHGKSETSKHVQERNERSNHIQGRNETSLAEGRDDRNNVVKTISNSENIEHNANSGANTEKSAHISENNRQFLMSLTNKTLSGEKTNLIKTTLVNSIETGAENVSNINAHFSSEFSKNLSPALKPDSCNSEPCPPPRSRGNSHISQVSAMESPIGKTNPKPAVPPKKHLKIPVSSPTSDTNNARASSETTNSFSSLKYGPDLNYKVASGSRTYLRSPSVLSNHKSGLSEHTGNNQSTSKLNSQFTSFTAHTIDVTENTSKTPPKLSGADFSYNENNSYDDESNFQPLTMSDLHSDDGKRERRKDITRREIQDVDSIANSGSHQQASDDQANTRKKSHFKASFKNLFAKKKGKVILADVEREVLKEMAASSKLSSDKNKTADRKKFQFSRNKMVGNLERSNFFSCVPVKELVFGIKNRRDQANSTSSPVKFDRKFNFCRKQDKLHPCSKHCRELNCNEYVQLQLQRNMDKHVKQNDRTLEVADKKIISKMLDASVDSESSLEKTRHTNSHSYTEENNTELHLVQQNFREPPSSLHCFIESQSAHQNLCKSQQRCTESPLCHKGLTESPLCHKGLTESPLCHKGLTELPMCHQSLTRPQSSLQKLVDPPLSQKSLTKSPSSHQSVIKSLQSQESFTMSPSSQQRVTKPPQSQESPTTLPSFQQGFTKSQQIHEILITSPSSHQSVPKSPQSQESLTTSLSFQESFTKSSQICDSLINSPSSHQSVPKLPCWLLPQNEITVNNTPNTVVNLHNNPNNILDKEMFSWHYQNQKNQKDSLEIRMSALNKTDLLKTAVSVCNPGCPTNIPSKELVGNSVISECKAIPYKLQCQPHRDFHLEMPQPDNCDCCQQYKNYEIRTTGWTEEAGHDNKDFHGRTDDKVSGQNCRSSRTITKVCKSSDTIQDNAIQPSNIHNIYNSKCTNSLKPCTFNGADSINSNSSCNLESFTKNKYLYNACQQQTLSNIQSLCHKRQLINKPVCDAIPPVCRLPYSLTYMHNRSKDSNESCFPDCALCSSDKTNLTESVCLLNHLAETLSERCVEVKSSTHFPCSYTEQSSKSGIVEIKNCVASDNCSIKTLTSATSCPTSQSKLKSELTEDHKTEDQLLITNEIRTSQTNLKEISQPEQTVSDLLIKRFSLEDKESCQQHRYRLYFDDETLSQESERA